MREIRDMSILEIDITNACMNQCSNCTRFCGQHKKPYFMDFETFRRAIDSLNDFEGLISIIGGEPLLHPEFERFAAYMDKQRRSKVVGDQRSRILVKDYLAYAQAQRWFENSYNKGRGYNLFTSIPEQYYDHYETIQDVFTHLFLNDHSSISLHQPILISRKDLGIPDEEFEQMRENCWLQNFWSASITPKGAFFCEVAGTLDLLTDGPGGHKIEPGWWKKDLTEFKDQFRYCDMCGMALKTFSRNANEGIDDVSVSWYKRLEEMGTPKFRDHRVLLFRPETAREKDGQNIGEDMNSISANYEPDYEKRVGSAAKNLRPRRVYGLIVEREENVTRELIDANLDAVNGFILAVDSESQSLEWYGKEERIWKRCCLEREDWSLGLGICRALEGMERHDWIVLLCRGTVLPADFKKRICSLYLNPGYLFRCKFGEGESLLFSGAAKALRRHGWDGLRHCRTVDQVKKLWQEKTYVMEPNFDDLEVIDIPYFRQMIFDEYNRDQDFKKRLRERIGEAAGDHNNGNIFVPHSAFIFHTLSITRLLENMGYQVYVMSSKKFKAYFEGWLSAEKLLLFEEDAFDYDKQKEVRDMMRGMAGYSGAVVPFFPGAGSIKPIDNYTDVLRTSEEVAGRIFAVVNIRRKFAEPEYNYWEAEDE